MATDPTPIRYCVCSGVSFAEMKAQGVNQLADAQRRFGAGLGCGLCQGYISEMIRSGRTAFDVDEQYELLAEGPSCEGA